MRTFRRWLHGEKRNIPPKPCGRPRTDEEIRTLVLKLATENAWGYTRILGELRKLGITNVSRSTVVNILREGGIDPGPKRGEGTWSDFIARHAKTLWACDFFSKKVWTTSGMVEFFVLFFLHVGSRRVHIAGMTPNPGRAWVVQQARNMSMLLATEQEKPAYLIRDLDGKFTKQFDDVFADDGVEVIKVGPQAPNLNAFAERWVLTVKTECLDHFIVFGEAHLRHLLSEFLAHFHEERPHQGLGNVLLHSAESPAAEGDIVCKERLGGLLKHYHRQAA